MVAQIRKTNLSPTQGSTDGSVRVIDISDKGGSDIWVETVLHLKHIVYTVFYTTNRTPWRA